MHARTIDTGATIAVLRAFGPPDVVELEPLGGGTELLIEASKFWTVVQSISYDATTQAALGDRYARASLFASDNHPFAQALSPFALQLNQAGHITFAVGVQAAGFTNAPSIVVPLPELVLLPGWTLKVDDAFDAAPAIISNARACLQRYQLVTVDELIGS